MDTRLHTVFRLAVEDYISTGNPIGSQYLVERYKLDMSPATIRNWFADLEEAGYLMQPHTSGGRVPTEEGFRHYAQTCVTPKPLSKRQHALLEQAIGSSVTRDTRWKVAAKALAEQASLAALVGLARHETFYTGLSQLFSQPEFQNWKHVVSLSEVLDRLDDALVRVRSTSYSEPVILVGRECPFGAMCSTVMLTIDDTWIALLGPQRMDYQTAYSSLSTLKQLYG